MREREREREREEEKIQNNDSENLKKKNEMISRNGLFYFLSKTSKLERLAPNSIKLLPFSSSSCYRFYANDEDGGGVTHSP